MASSISVALFKIYTCVCNVLSLLFADLSGSILLVKITTWTIVNLQIVLCVVNVILYLKLLKEMKISQKKVQKSETI